MIDLAILLPILVGISFVLIIGWLLMKFAGFVLGDIEDENDLDGPTLAINKKEIVFAVCGTILISMLVQDCLGPGRRVIKAGETGEEKRRKIDAWVSKEMNMPRSTCTCALRAEGYREPKSDQGPEDH